MIQAKVRSTTHRRRITTKPMAPRGLLTISSATRVWKNDYDTLLSGRARLVSEELGKRIINREIDTDGQPARDNDYEEEAVAFE